MTEPGEVRLVRHDAVAVVTVDRPAARNALTRAMKDRLIELCGTVGADPEVRAMVLRSAGGRSFISGADIREMGEVPSIDGFLELAVQVEDLYAAIEAVPVPTVAVVEGYALGSGFFAALACDLCVCTTGATFGVPAASKIGNCLAPGEYARLVTAVGVPRARQLLLTGRLLDGAAARDWGLVYEAVAPDDLEAALTTLTELLAASAPMSIWAAKESVRRVIAGAPADDDILRRVLRSEDFQEGMAAFAEKRPPVWRNR